MFAAVGNGVAVLSNTHSLAMVRVARGHSYGQQSQSWATVTFVGIDHSHGVVVAGVNKITWHMLRIIT